MSEAVRGHVGATTSNRTVNPRAVARTKSAPRPGRVRHAIGYALLCLVTLLFVSPLIYMVATSLKPADQVFTTPPTLWGRSLEWDNYVQAFTYLPFARFILNGVFVAAVGTAINVAVAVLSGYAFSRLRWRGRNTVFLLFLVTLMIPQDVLVIPMYVMMQGFGWVDTFQALIIPWAFTALGAFLVRQFFLTVPQELDDAARVDGAGAIRTFFSVMMPLARPTMAVLAVFSFISYWNSFLWPLVIVNDVEARGTIPLGLQQFFGQQGSEWNLVMAASVISMLPTVILLILLQKHLVKGIVTSGLGGR
ncbi:carbohydrate ABC transporter membrane protein 2 (CUT1 family) [Curtobacterium sp. PhB142]|uniref:carbohydrate ABC transporter permease n=1 Tax=unclassified Curtobacterium TaxID=257496 RepID=UPI00104A277F|nr:MULTISPECIES: carbohydrate ABC transporter permease [unclassified Curtobacterium]TCL86484.1 carbohydrate ABC transporter membrane protein 2 (CUT1 family) [Curtobacterium sp. PhB142]TCM02674.1 carbohydrate ABC transporter membrane protein 2 (CUT1 family) [Curtobacterium sp. PhB134]